MKKIYEIPTTKVVKIAINHMVCASEKVVISSTDYDPTTSGEIQSRRHSSLWDDEE